MPAPIIPDAETARSKGEEFCTLIEGDIDDRSDAFRMRQQVRAMYFGLRRRKLRYEGQPDIHLHVLAEKIETVVTKEMNAFWAAEPHVHVGRLPKEFDIDETRAVERWQNYAIDEDIPNFYGTFENWIRNSHLDSVAVVKTWYNFEERHTVIVEEAETMWYKGEMDMVGEEVQVDRPKVPYEILASHFGNIQISDARIGNQSVDPLTDMELDGLYVVLDFVENGMNYQDVEVVFEPSRYINKTNLRIYRPITVKDNVEAELLEWEDLVVPYRTCDLQTAPRLAQKYWMTLAEIRQSMLSEGWDITDEELEVLKNRSLAEKQEEVPKERSMQNQKDWVTGQHDSKKGPPQGQKSSELKAYLDNKILVFEVYAREDIHGTGVFSEVVYQIPYALRKIVKANYLEELFPHGRRPFATLHSIPISGRWYGWSLGALLTPINEEVNTIINQVTEAQEIINNPWFGYLPTALHGDKPIRLRPGQGIPLTDKDGLIFPHFPQQPLANLSAMDSLLLFADRLTVTPQAVGSTQVRNAPRTARATLAMLSEASSKVDSFITAAQKGGWEELMFQVYALYDAFGSDAKYEKVTGRKRFQRTKNVDLRSNTRFIFKGNTVNTNKSVMQTIAQTRYTVLANEPLYLRDMRARRALIEDFLHHFSEGADIEKLLPAEEAGLTRAPMSQESENQIIKQGVPLTVLPMDDDVQHLQAIDQERSKASFQEWTPEAVTMLASHYIQHQQQLLVKQQTSQVQGGGGQGNNVAPIATEDLSALEGGNQ